MGYSLPGKKPAGAGDRKDYNFAVLVTLSGRSYVNCFGLVVFTMALALSGSAQQSPDPAAVLQRTGERLLDDLDRMPRYTCVQTITRTYYEAKPVFRRPTCSALIAAHDTRKRTPRILGWDRLRLDVGLVNGTNVYSWVGAPRFTDDTLDKLAGRGPLGSGDFGVFLSDILLRAPLEFQGAQVAEGRQILKYSYNMPLEKSTYRVKTSDEWAKTAYSGTLLLDPNASDIVTLTVRTAELPESSSACQAISEVTYGRIAIRERMILVPRETDLYAINPSGQESLSQTRFANCREYGSTSRLLVDGASSAGASVATKPAPSEPTAPLPAGLHFEARITTPIDSNTAAAGDPVEAILRSPMRDKSKAIMAPAGTRLHGRMRNVKWWSEPADHYQITIELESIEMGGRNVPLKAVLYPPHMATFMGTSSRMILLRPDDPSIGGTFFFRDDHLLLKSLDSDWVTVSTEPAAAPDAGPQK